jgi:hypothetical protein
MSMIPTLLLIIGAVYLCPFVRCNFTAMTHEKFEDTKGFIRNCKSRKEREWLKEKRPKDK